MGIALAALAAVSFVALLLCVFFLGVLAGLTMTLQEMRSGFYTINGKVFRVTMREVARERD